MSNSTISYSESIKASSYQALRSSSPLPSGFDPMKPNTHIESSKCVVAVFTVTLLMQDWVRACTTHTRGCSGLYEESFNAIFLGHVQYWYGPVASRIPSSGLVSPLWETWSGLHLALIRPIGGSCNSCLFIFHLPINADKSSRIVYTTKVAIS